MMIRAAVVAAALAASSAAVAQPAAAPKAVTIPAPGGEVYIPHPAFQKAYDEMKFAPARRVGDTLYVSGAVAGRLEGEGNDTEAFKKQVRRAFRQLDMTLKAAGATFADVAMLNTFHVWEGPDYPAPHDEQFKAFNEIKSEFMTAPHPAWTAVGTTGLLGKGGIVEIQMIAKIPAKS